MAHPRPSGCTPRGSTLLEAMIALAILLIGLLGMAQLQIWSFGSNQAARVQTQALTMARELAAALERLPYDDALLTPTYTAPAPPARFGQVQQLDHSLDASDFTAWDDANQAALPNVRLDASLDRDALDPALPAFQRRWVVWAPPDMASAYVRVIAVSVVYRERAFQRAREVTFLTQVSHSGAAMTTVAAQR